MENLIDEFSRLNKELTVIVSKRIELAKVYYLQKYPKLKYGNYVIKDGKVYKVCNDNVTHQDSLRYHFEDGRYYYNYDNKIEKEYRFYPSLIRVTSTGFAKNRDCFWCLDVVYDSLIVICNDSDLEKLLKEHGIKTKFNDSTLWKLNNKINLVV